MTPTSQWKEKAFKDLPERERSEFFALLAYAILRHPSCFKMAQEIVDFAEKYGIFDGARHGISKILDETSES